MIYNDMEERTGRERRYATLTPIYTVTVATLNHTRIERGVTRDVLAAWLRVARNVNDLTVTYTRTWQYLEARVTMCAGCLARPTQWETDCDGTFPTASCGQCDWWTAFAMHL